MPLMACNREIGCGSDEWWKRCQRDTAKALGYRCVALAGRFVDIHSSVMVHPGNHIRAQLFPLWNRESDGIARTHNVIAKWREA
jgi:hypothetical protein